MIFGNLDVGFWILDACIFLIWEFGDFGLLKVLFFVFFDLGFWMFVFFFEFVCLDFWFLDVYYYYLCF